MQEEQQDNVAAAFLARHPSIRHADLLMCDCNGILRGKRVTAASLGKVWRDGIFMPGSLFASDIRGNTIEASGLGYEEGDRDRCCRPVAATLAPVPWQPFAPAAQVILSMFEEDGRPFFADPRQVLARVLARLHDDGMLPVVAVELEFYLIDRERDAQGRPQTPRSGPRGERERDTQVYGLADLDRFAGLLDEIADVCELQGIPAETAVAEYAPAQFEINLAHQPDALAACDHAIMLKRAIRAVATRYGLEATFMAKPWTECSGSGLHLHASLLGEDGNNRFATGPDPVNDTLRHAIGGLAATLPESIALLAPNANSYRRFQREQFVPLGPTWGANNRTVAFRIPAGPAQARRFEHRVAGADANPYLVTAAILAGMHHGIAHHLEPPPAMEGNAYEQDDNAGFATNWLAALESFDAGTVMPAYLGADFCRLYSACRRDEREQFNRQVTRDETDLYLDHF